MDKRHWKSAVAYAGLLFAACALGVCATWFFGDGVDDFAYDVMFRNYQPPPWQSQSVILAIDEETLRATPGGMHAIRKPLTDALRITAAAKPKTVVIDLTLADQSENPQVDDALAAAMRANPNLVLASELLTTGWEHPLPQFRQAAAEVGHVYTAAPEDVTRAIPLEKHRDRTQVWALSLQAYRLFRSDPDILLTPEDVRLGSRSGADFHVDAVLPVPPDAVGDRLMRVRFTPSNVKPVPRVSMQALRQNPALASAFTGKAVFIGVTAITEVRDRLMTPIGNGRQTSGVEIHADAFETMLHGLYITDIGRQWVLLFCLALAAAAGLVFRYLPGWWAYAGGVAVISSTYIAPYVFFTHSRVFSFAAPATVAWLCVATAAAYYHLVVRRDWRKEQAARERYQQAMHFVTHEMRTPLSAIQGSSELISRYPLTEEKRKQVAQLINSESKRLARMVEVFLSVERLSAGQMELKRETIPVQALLELCVARTTPLAERKHITIELQPAPLDMQITGDRELVEYACYNLLTNAVKYSPQQTVVTVSTQRDDGYVRIAVKDQGIGMDQKEVKQVFQKFYRTAKAEQSGEAGTGIGLSIVQQIVEQHGGRIDVVSQPGEGSCFMLVLPAVASADAPTLAEQR